MPHVIDFSPLLFSFSLTLMYCHCCRLSQHFLAIFGQQQAEGVWSLQEAKVKCPQHVLFVFFWSSVPANARYLLGVAYPSSDMLWLQNEP